MDIGGVGTLLKLAVLWWGIIVIVTTQVMVVVLSGSTPTRPMLVALLYGCPIWIELQRV